MGVKIPHRDMVIDSELLELDKQAKFGDAVSGWRGDETMFVCLQPMPLGSPMVQVWGLDAYGREYIAAETPAKQGWRHTLLAKLVKGDWQHRAGNLHEEVMAQNAKVRQDAEDAFREELENDLAPKLRWALQRDGLGTKDQFFFPGPKGA